MGMNKINTKQLSN